MDNHVQSAYSSVLESVLHEASKEKFYPQVGAENVLHLRYDPITASEYTTTFSIDGLGDNTILDRRFILATKVKFQVQNGVNGTTPPPRRLFVPSAYPVNSAIQSIRLTLNGLTVDSRPSEMVRVFSRNISDYDKYRFHSGTPTMTDNDTTIARMELRLNDNPHSRLASVGHELDSRYAFQPTVDGVHTAGGVWEYEYTFHEQLFTPSLLEMIQHSGLSNVDKLQVTINWHPDTMARMFKKTGRSVKFDDASFDYDAEGSGEANFGYVTNSFTFNTTNYEPTLQLRWTRSSVNIPDVQVIPHYHQQTYLKDASALNDNTVGNINYAFRIGIVPDSMFIYVRPQGSSSVDRLDASMQIRSITLRVGDKASILTAATQYQLYQITNENNFRCSFYEWLNGSSVLALRFGKDIPGFIAGSIGSYDIGIEISFLNNLGAQYKPELVVVTFEPGVLEISRTNADEKRGYSQVLAEAQLQQGNVAAVAAVSDTPVVTGGKMSFLKPLKAVTRGLNDAAQLAAAVNPAMMAARAMGGLTNNALQLAGGKVRGGALLKA